jgi:hypothetical protein
MTAPSVVRIADAMDLASVALLLASAGELAAQQVASGAGHRLDAVYLRAAQAYMLISMPTGTSTIFGVFQAIRVSRVLWRDVCAE